MAGETKVSDLIKDIRQADLILPEFQGATFGIATRPAASSIASTVATRRGHSIRKAPTPSVVPAELPSDETKGCRLILDGQQRLTSVYVLMGEEPPTICEGEGPARGLVTAKQLRLIAYEVPAQ